LRLKQELVLFSNLNRAPREEYTARGDQLARHWKIIQTLITSRQGKSAADLAGKIECHPRILYRDLEALQAALQKKSVESENPRVHSSILCLGT
jgi:hypothetical protein